MWAVVQCPKLECSRHMVVRHGTKRKKCVFCGRSFKVDDNHVNLYSTQERARDMVKKFNLRIH